MELAYSIDPYMMIYKGLVEDDTFDFKGPMYPSLISIYVLDSPQLNNPGLQHPLQKRHVSVINSLKSLAIRLFVQQLVQVTSLNHQSFVWVSFCEGIFRWPMGSPYK